LSTSLPPSVENSHERTFSLTVAFAGASLAETKDAVTTWLVAQGIDTYVEGSVDHCDIPDESGIDKDLLFTELGGNESPIILYSYDEAWLRSIAAHLNTLFPQGISCELSSLATKDWQEGWKDGFRPITTAVFYLYPPWDMAPCPEDKIPLVINPGMAFGTGQHATTQLSLEALESLRSFHDDPQHCTLLDVGTGSGILAIAAKKLGYAHVDACDIDADAMCAVKENCHLNQVVGIQRWHGSIVPTLDGKTHCYQVILANILYPVLEELLPHFARLLAPGGLLVLSGILTEQKAGMVGLCTQYSLQLTRESDRDDWSCVVLQAPH
jgi:ribosomal protein L11 methyltransferase